MAINFTPTSALADAVFGLDLLSQFLGNIDVVGIYQNGAQVFQKGRPLKANIKEPARIMKHPAETGVILADHIVIDPVIIEMPMMISSQYYLATYQQIKNARNNATVLQVKTPVQLYDNMIIADMPHEESPDHFSSIIMFLRLEQVIFETTGSPQDSIQNNYNPADAVNQNTQQTGLLQAATLGKQLLTSATGVISYVSTARKFF